MNTEVVNNPPRAIVEQAPPLHNHNVSKEVCIRVISLYEGDMTYEKIGRLLDVPKSTVGYIIRRHNKLGVIGPLKKGGNKLPIKVTPEVCTAVTDELDRDCTLTLDELKLFVIQRFHIPAGISITTIHRMLEEYCYTLKDLRKLPFGRNSERTKDLRVEYISNISPFVGNCNFIYVDESNFNLWTTRGKGRAKAGQRACYVVPNSKGRQVSLILAISNIIGVVEFKTIQGSCKGIDYLEYLHSLVERLKVIKRNNRWTMPFVIIMDNCAIHHTEDVQNFLDNMDDGFRYSYLPPYSPFLNPIEESFSAMKAEFKKIIKGCKREIENMMGRLNKSYEECRRIYVEQKIIQALPAITVEKCSSFHDHSQTFFQRCLNRETL